MQKRHAMQKTQPWSSFVYDEVEELRLVDWKIEEALGDRSHSAGEVDRTKE